MVPGTRGEGNQYTQVMRVGAIWKSAMSFVEYMQALKRLDLPIDQRAHGENRANVHACKRCWCCRKDDHNDIGTHDTVEDRVAPIRFGSSWNLGALSHTRKGELILSQTEKITRWTIPWPTVVHRWPFPTLAQCVL